MVKDDPMKYYEARTGFTGKTLTHSQFDEAWNISGIINREIRKTGSFREKLTAYAHAFACNDTLDPMRGETILRDIYKARFDETMNELRENLMGREAFAREAGKDHALRHAKSIGDMICGGQTMPFYQAADNASGEAIT